ncbi:hypothetical protein Cv017_12115 [Chromobacterium subtsugae]|nr:hypothetical protein Cv017_12115 [Chromobacterium subtsugae]
MVYFLLSMPIAWRGMGKTSPNGKDALRYFHELCPDVVGGCEAMDFIAVKIQSAGAVRRETVCWLGL